MNSKFKRTTSATALALALAMGLMYLPVSLAESAGNGNVTLSPQAGAVLTTGNNQPVNVNGASTVSGATVMTGATIETPDQVNATLSVPGLFTLNIAPRANLTVEFDRNGIKVNLVKGCVVLNTKKGTTGEIDTTKGVAGQADGSKDSRLNICDPTIATAPAAAAGTEMGLPGKIAIIGAFVGLVSIPLLTGGSNPSPSGP